MRSTLVVKWLRAVVLSALLLVPQSGPSIAAWSAASAGTVVLSTPSSAWARSSSSSSSSSSSKSSGGYSRPSASSSSSSSSRTPSASSSSSSSSGSSGYTRPRTPSTGSSAQAASQSASDKAISRQGASDALARYRDSDKPVTKPTTTTTSRDSRSDSGWSWGSGSSRRPSTTSYSPSRGGSVSNWYSKRGWSPSSYMQGGRNFGMWDAMFLWFMLDSLTKPSHAAFFHNHQDDPGVQQWRTEAERLAKDNKELAAKLAQLDKSKAALKDQPVDSSVMPSDIPIDVATGSTTGKDSSSALRQSGESGESGGGSGLLWVVLILGAVLALLWLARRRKAARKSNEEDPVRLGMVGNYISQKISGKPYEPSLFRVGMTVTIDPTPFLLSAGLTKVKIPEGGLTSIPKLSKVTSAGTTLHRLYLPDVESFFQLHLDKDGMPDECRYFSVIDQVTPADEAEWGFWLDRAEGMIGWPEFQTKDGKLYPRAWTPGSGRIKPLEMKEELKDVRGTNNRTVNAMLYATPTGGAAPAPENEYILVSAIEEGGQAWVEIAAGIDVSPASLSLT